MKDLALGVNSHDLEVTDFDLSFVSGLDYYRQKVKVRLWFFRGEWYLDTSEGTPFHRSILVKNPNIPLVDTLIKARILETEGVTELKSYTSSYESSLRRFEVSFEAQTDAGLLEATETVP